MISSGKPITYNEIAFSQFQSSTLKKLIGNLILRPLFFPLADPPSHSLKSRLDKKKSEVTNFWEGSSETGFFSESSKIRELFTHRQEKILMDINGKTLAISVEIIESKDSSSRNFYQFALGLNNLSTINSYLEGVYPFLETYLHKKQENSSIPPARFFLISAYDTTVSPEQTPYHTESLDESGLIFSNTLKKLAHIYGEIHLLVVHSVSAFRLAKAAKYGIDINHICVDRGASSVEELSKIYFLGRIGLMPIGRWCGWEVDVGSEIHEHLLPKKDLHIVVSGVERDNRFPGSANLCNHLRIREAAGFQAIPSKMQVSLSKIATFALGVFGIMNDTPSLVAMACCITILGKDSLNNSPKTNKIEQLAKVVLLYFDFFHILPHSTHHTMALSNFSPKDLFEDYKKQDFLSEGEPLPSALLNHSLSQVSDALKE